MSECPTYIGMAALKQLLPGKTKETVWRYNTHRGGRNQLPPSELDYGQRDPAWTLETILEWADRTGLRSQMDEAVLAEICQSREVK